MKRPSLIKWNHERLKKLVGHYNDGLSVGEIALKMELSQKTIENKLRAMGYPLAGRG